MRILLIASAILFALLFWGIVRYTPKAPRAVTALPTEKHFHIQYGNPLAKTDLTIFDEFACAHCQIFHRTVMPIIDRDYVDKGLVCVTLIPTAFLEESAAAWEALYRTKEKALYDTFMQTSLEELAAMPPLPESAAREHNIALAKQIYPHDILLPIVLVNNQLIPNTASLTKAIDATL